MSVAERSSATASALSQFRSAGTTYQGAQSVDVSAIVSSYASRQSSTPADVEVLEAELPPLLGIVDALLKAPALLVAPDIDVRAVEDADLTACGRERVHAPEVVVGELRWSAP
jgi:hypothetical protein